MVELAIVSASSSRTKSDSAVTIGKRYMTPANKKVQAKLNRQDRKKQTQVHKSAKSQALAKERARYQDQVKAIREKHRSQLSAEIEKAKAQHAKKVEAIRGKKASKPAPRKPAKPATVADLTKK